MAEVIELPDRAALLDHLRADLRAFGYELLDRDVRIERYGYDDRIGWHTYIVSIRNKEIAPGHRYFGGADPQYFGAIGFTDEGHGTVSK